jgi:hypothetical protein
MTGCTDCGIESLGKVLCALLDALYFKNDQCGEIRAVVNDYSDIIPVKGTRGGAFAWVSVTARRVTGLRLVAVP